MINPPRFRPWGQLDWVVPRIPNCNWSFIGNVSPEDRCLAAWHVLSSLAPSSTGEFMQVIDPPSRYSSAIEKKCHALALRLYTMGLRHSDIKPVPLLARSEELVKTVNAFIASASTDVICDISTFPKRFFFPAIKLLLSSDSIHNLVVTYTLPDSYSAQQLSEDPDPWRHLPLFAPPYPEPEVKLLILGVGFEPLALPELLQEDYRGVGIKLLFPFPPGPPSFQRAWEFVRTIEDSFPHAAREPIRVDARDVSDAFDHICAATDRGAEYAVLAPYGPKTISLAMCLYSIVTGHPAYYTQPKVYSPDYSTGVSDTYAYCVKLQGHNLYSL